MTLTESQRRQLVHCDCGYEFDLDDLFALEGRVMGTCRECGHVSDVTDDAKPILRKIVLR